MGGGLESRCVGRVYVADGVVHGTIRTVNTTYPKHVELRIHSLVFSLEGRAWQEPEHTASWASSWG